MGKAEKSGGFLTPKAIGNRIKAKGLTKLRWYCQMCEKACRDENGFKCHCMSESHRRQMLMFQNNPNRFMDDFSRDFHKNFIETLSHRHGTKRCKAITIYNEMIAGELRAANSGGVDFALSWHKHHSPHICWFQIAIMST